MNRIVIKGRKVHAMSRIKVEEVKKEHTKHNEEDDNNGFLDTIDEYENHA